MTGLMKEDLSTWQEAVVVLFLIPVSFLNLYQFHKLVSIFRAIRGTRFFTDKPKPGGVVPEGREPIVTIQICVYNEAAVVQKTIDAACQVDWPKDKLFVQVLDDSTDHTSTIIEESAAKWRAKGFNCHRLTRPNRIGYKAGNLSAHMKDIKGEFVALFDSDHRCEPQYLRCAIPQFFKEDGTSNDKIALAQTPWAYYNTHQNLLTEYDALILDYSHVVDQISRATALKCFGFNGTGGVWRKSAIEAAGGWKWDTVTEDLDISCLSHMEGYEFVYLRHLPQQLELPSGIRAHRKQRHRWTKGYMQVFRKHLWQVLSSPNASLKVKIEGYFHMTTGLCYVFALILFILAPIMVNFEGFTLGITLYCAVLPVFTHLFGLVLTIYSKVPSSNGHYKGFCSRTKRLLLIPVQIIFAMGMTVFETVATFDGLFSDDATFHRTPKEGAERLSLYLDEDEDETVEEEDWKDVEMANDACKREAHEKKKKLFKLSPFVAHTLEGLAGVLVACYLIVWAPILLRNGITRNYSPAGLILMLMPLLPVIGLLYMHLKFLAATFSSHYQTRRKKASDDTKTNAAVNSNETFDTKNTYTRSGSIDIFDHSETNTNENLESVLNCKASHGKDSFSDSGGIDISDTFDESETNSNIDAELIVVPSANLTSPTRESFASPGSNGLFFAHDGLKTNIKTDFEPGAVQSTDETVQTDETCNGSENNVEDSGMNTGFAPDTVISCNETPKTKEAVTGPNSNGDNFHTHNDTESTTNTDFEVDSVLGRDETSEMEEGFTENDDNENPYPHALPGTKINTDFKLDASPKSDKTSLTRETCFSDASPKSGTTSMTRDAFADGDFELDASPKSDKTSLTKETFANTERSDNSSIDYDSETTTHVEFESDAASSSTQRQFEDDEESLDLSSLVPTREKKKVNLEKLLNLTTSTSLKDLEDFPKSELLTELEKMRQHDSGEFPEVNMNNSQRAIAAALASSRRRVFPKKPDLRNVWEEAVRKEYELSTSLKLHTEDLQLPF